MAVSDRSNPSLARFWGVVLAVMFYAFVMAGLLGFPAHRTGPPPPGPAGTGRGQVAGVPHPESEASASAPMVTLTEKAASAQAGSGGTPLAGAAPPSPQASPTQVPMIASAAKSVPTANGPVQAVGGPQTESEASASAPIDTPTENVGSAQAGSGGTPLAGAAPPSPQASPTQVPLIASAAKPTAGVPHPESEASASAPIDTPTENAANAQPNSGATPPAAAELPAQQAIGTQVPTIVIAAKPVPPAVSGPTLVDVRHRCGNGEWTWQSGVCPTHPRPIVWRWVLRGCAIRVGHLCIGAHYAPIEVAGASQRQVWR